MTDALIQALAHALDGPLHTVLHIGAGASALQACKGLSPQRFVLVEGDPDTHADLAADLQDSGRADVQALHRVVLPEAGTVLWHRYNVRRLNAPQSMAALRAVYPRLVELTALPQAGVALEQLAGEVLPPDADDGMPASAHALVLDVPGQEGALLAALPPELLRRFRYVALRAIAQPTGQGWAALTATVELLRQACFGPPALGAVSEDALWPVAVMRFDAEAFSRAQLQARCQALEAALAQARDYRAASEQALRHDLDVQAQRAAECQGAINALTQAKAAAEKRAANCATQLQQMTQQRDQQAKLVAERQAQIDALAQAKASTEKQAADRAVQMEQMTQQRDEQARRHQENVHLAQGLRGEVESLTQKLAAVQVERDTLQVKLNDQGARQALLDQEILRAEAQLELIKDVLLREKNF